MRLELGNQDPERFSGSSGGLLSVLLEKDHNPSVLTCPNETFLTLSFLPLNWSPKITNSGDDPVIQPSASSVVT